MSTNQLSSGDLLADRRADYARMLAEGGDFAEAAELMEQALDLTPRWAAGWFRLADYAEKSGRKEAAVAALEKALALDPSDVFGAALKLALLSAADVPAAPPSRYVGQLFDDYADRFEAALVARLDYSVPERLAALLAKTPAVPPRFARACDLGCGTGLFGERIRDRVEVLEGFDLSANMLAKAGAKGIYDRLAPADLSLPAPDCGLFGPGDPEGRADLASAADVLMYLGDLTGLFGLVARLLAPQGVFAFSVEDAGRADGIGDSVVLRPSLRYAHSEAYVRTAAADAGLAVVAVEHSVIRKDAGEPVHGLLFLACRG
ncbi:methyltransferase domain-containing protein [Rhizobium sp. TRM95111]|uniref:methyltransferase domain-containing protein n=1 Tax=Rhizobium alarense TaxID=2846851 RepID=UPI001F32908F|nr:methyltransferase domain-containing protein [Rhizobium alarense]MCF3642231.1 methyltransferase domain-containing protein [Rhizobium alarense]